MMAVSDNSPHNTQPAPPPMDSARARQVELILERVETIPTLSPVAARLLNMGSAEEVDVADVVKIIESDPALSTRILGLCRKADRGLGDRITTVRRAVLMLGIDSVRSAALSVSVYDLMSKDDDAARQALDAAVSTENAAGEGPFPAAPAAAPQEPLFDRKGFWKHSIAVACACELIAASHPKLRVLPDEAFLAGLLHDVGKLVLELVLPLSYERVVRLASRRTCDSAPIERAVIGLDHHTAGRRIAEHWNLPAAIQGVIWLHGQPYQALPNTPDRPLIGVVGVAKALCRQLHLGWSGDFGVAPDAERLWAEMGLKAQGPAIISAPLHAAVADRLNVLGLDEATPPGLLLESLANANRQLSTLNSALQERARQSQAQARVLEAINTFHAPGRNRRTVADTLALVGASAVQALGPAFYAALFQPAPDEPWQIFQFSPSGAIATSRVLEDAPGRRQGAWSLGALTSATQLNVAMLGLLPWLSEYLTGAPDLRTLRLLPLMTGVSAEPEAGPAAILVNDRDLGETLLGPAQLNPLIATWAAAIFAASERARARRLGEQLAESGRSLAEMQARLTQQESMARLGETTAGAAHEMNNPLTIISGHSQLLLSRLRDDRDRAATDAIVHAAADLSELISSLHLMSSAPVCKPVATTLPELVARALVAATARLPSPPKADLDLEAGPGGVFLDPDMFVQVLAELIVNAAQSCPDQAIRIGACLEALDDQLVVTVKDHGPGLSHRALRHAFDPFFSERPAGRGGRGRGLGLTRAQALARAMQASISLDSRPDAGALATLTLRSWRPIAAEAAGLAPGLSPHQG